MVIGGEFFEPNPESPLTQLVFKLDDIKAHCLDARTALSTLTGTELKTKAKDLGRMDSISGMRIYIDVPRWSSPDVPPQHTRPKGMPGSTSMNLLNSWTF